jgi:Arc/MetJ-type ribon-helix-helix transcriptional regulator
MGEAIEKTRVNVTLSNDILKWIDENIDSHRFASRSHALEFAVMSLKEADARRATLDKLVMGLDTRIQKLEGGKKKETQRGIDVGAMLEAVTDEVYYS